MQDPVHHTNRKNFQKYMQPRKQAYLWLLVFCGSSLSWYALCVILAFPGHTFGPLGGFFSFWLVVSKNPFLCFINEC